MKYAVSWISLDFAHTSSPLTLAAKQGDSVREIIVRFKDNGVEYPLEPGCIVVFTAEKPSGAKIFNTCEVEGNAARYRFTAQTVSEIGPMKCEFKIFADMSDPAKLTSPRFVVNVEEPVFNDGDVPESSYEFNAIVDIVRKTTMEYLEAHPVVTDKTLTMEDNAADAKAVGDKFKEYLPKSGGAMTGPIAMGGNRITGMAAPTESGDAATKGYVEGYVASRRLKKTATLSAKWVGNAAPYTQTVTISGILETDMPLICPVYSDDLDTAVAQREAWGMVSQAVCSAGVITFTCFEDKPEAAIPIQVGVIR